MDEVSLFSNTTLGNATLCTDSTGENGPFPGKFSWVLIAKTDSYSGSFPCVPAFTASAKILEPPGSAAASLDQRRSMLAHGSPPSTRPVLMPYFKA